MKKNKLIVTIFFATFGLIAEGQQTEKNVELRLTPSPTAASLGEFGNTEVKNSTGGAYHKIPLFDTYSGDIKYNPQIEYFSNGFKLDEWGGRLGMGWSDNFSGIIQREVRSVPDEHATGYPALTESTFINRNSANWELMKNLEMASRNRSGQDAEYDMFHFNAFGVSGSFIIKQGVCTQLNYQSKFRIDLLTINPYTFCITDDQGFKYYFGTNSHIELTSYSADNNCDQGGGPLYDIPTAWFLTKITSPKGSEINFNYAAVNYTYMYNFEQEYNYKRMIYGGIDIVPAPADHGINNSFFNTTFCYREKLTKTRYLTDVSGKGWRVAFTYVNRRDLINDKLLKNMSLYNEANVKVRDFEFEHDQLTSTASIENNLSNTLGQSFDLIGLKTRYFLKSLKSTLSGATHTFSYIKPEQLRHRFSFAQDIAGFYNGLGGTGFVPKDGLNSNVEDVRGLMATGDRSASINSQIGLLNKIKYPTGGYDTIVYEQNTYLASETSEEREVVDQTFLNTVNGEQNFSSQIFTLSGSQSITIKVSSDYQDPEYPYDNDGSFHWVRFELWNLTDNMKISLDAGPPYRDQITMKLYENHTATLNLVANKSYQLKATLYGTKTILSFYTEYLTSTNPIQIERPFYGVRVKNLISKSLTGPDISKSYYYRKFTESGTQLNFSTIPSSRIPIDIARFVWPAFYERVSSVGGTSSIAGYYMYYRISAASIHNFHVFNGYPIAYSHVTEVTGGNSFIANEYLTVGNSAGRKVTGDENVKIHLSNDGFTNGFPMAQYLGTISNNIYNLKNAQFWSYKEDLNVPTINNFFITQTYSPTQNTLTSSDIDTRYRPYAVVYIPLLSKSYKLSSDRKVRYELGEIVTSSTSYIYDNLIHLQPTRTTVTKSDGSKDVTLTTYPDDYPSGTAFIDNMKSAGSHLVAYPIEQVRYKEVGTAQTILSGTITKYLTGGKGLLDQVLELETPTPLALSAFKFSNRAAGQLPPAGGATAFAAHAAYAVRLTYGNYDAFGNPQQILPAFGAPTTYIWSYGGQYPVAEIKNASFATVQTAMGGAATLTTFTASSPAEADLRSKLNGIRASLPNSSLTYYTYKPLIGLTSSTDPSGRTTYYSYDGFGRLQTVKDTQQKTKEVFNYHYRNQ